MSRVGTPWDFKNWQREVAQMAKKKPAKKQVEVRMDINEVVALAQKIHDAEHINLGSASTREYRNAFWARVIGCVHHGHKTYNAKPDKQWHLKKAGPNSQQSDDVAVSMPSKLFWDCIPGSGADGYRFQANGPETLPVPPQVIMVPPVPDGSGTQPGPGPTPQPPSNTVQFKAYDGDAKWIPLSQLMEKDYLRAHPGSGLDGGCGMWLARTIHDCYMGESASAKPMTFDESVKKHRAEWCAALGIPVE